MMKKILLFSLTILLFSNCFGDKKIAIGTDFNDTSFVNKGFKTKKIFKDLAAPCSYLSKAILAKLYNTKEENIFLIEGNNTISKGCAIRIKLSDSEFDYITGVINFYEEPNKTQDGSTWVETWQIQKNVSKSAEWIPNLGKAAFFKGKKRELRVKFDNYVFTIVAPGGAFNQVEKAKNRDYKKIAIELAKQTPLF
jgi:hypothetical protein